MPTFQCEEESADRFPVGKWPASQYGRQEWRPTYTYLGIETRRATPTHNHLGWYLKIV